MKSPVSEISTFQESGRPEEIRTFGNVKFCHCIARGTAVKDTTQKWSLPKLKKPKKLFC